MQTTCKYKGIKLCIDKSGELSITNNENTTMYTVFAVISLLRNLAVLSCMELVNNTTKLQL